MASFLLPLFFFALSLANAILSQTISTIYSPTSMLEVRLNNTVNIMRGGCVADSTGLTFLAGEAEGVIIVDPTNAFQTKRISTIGSIIRVNALRDGKFLLLQPKNGFISLFRLNLLNTDVTLVSQATEMQSNKIQSVFLLNNDKWVACIKDDLLIIFDISSHASFVQIGSVQIGFFAGRITQEKDMHLFIVRWKLIVVRMVYSSSTNSLKLDIVFSYLATFVLSDFKITNDGSLMFLIDQYSGLSYSKGLDFTSIQNDQVIENYVFTRSNWWPSVKVESNKITLSSDNNLLIIGVPSIGIYIFDIRGLQINISDTPLLFQVIKVTGNSFSVFLSPDEQSLNYVNGKKLSVFQKIRPSLNEVVPSILNPQQASFTKENIFFAWRCYVANNDEYLFGAFDQSGIYIYDLKNSDILNPKLLNVFPTNGNLLYYDSVIFYDEYFIIVGDYLGALLSVYRMSDIRNMNPLEPVSRLIVQTQDVSCECIIFNSDKSLIGIACENRFYFVDASKGMLNLSLAGVLNELIDSASMIFSKDKKYVLGAARNSGIFSINISDIRQPFIEQYMMTTGGLDVIASADLKYAFISEGPSGIGIVDLSFLPQIVFISRLQLEGSVVYILPLYNDNFLLVSTSVLGFVSLVDIRDYTAPKLLQTFATNTGNGIASCTTSNASHAFFTQIGGFISIPLVSFAKVHTELMLEKGRETNNISYIKQSNMLGDNNSEMLISERYQMQFYLLYPTQGLKLVKVFYYQDYIRQELPYWLVFNQQQQNLNMQIVKDALGSNPSLPQLNTILLELKTKLTASSFTYPSLNIDSNNGTTIYKELHSMGIIDFEGRIVTDKFERQDILSFSYSSPSAVYNLDQEVMYQIKRTLQYSVTYNPVIFRVGRSLKFFKVPTHIADTASWHSIIDKVFVFSIQSSVQLYLQVSENMGQFVEIYYDGVISQISNFSTRLKLEGPVSNINQILLSKVLFFANSTRSNIVFSIILDDSVNYQIQESVAIEQAFSFIMLKQNLSIKHGKSLQTQFESFYQQNIIYIVDSFSFEFSSDTFLNPDTKVLSYTAFFKENPDGEFVTVLSDSWIQQSGTTLRFFGLPPANMYGTILTIKIIASDGYTTVSDTFIIKVTGIPFVYIISMAVKIFGPIFTLLGVYQYRSYFFNVWFKSKNQLSSEIIYINQPYFKKITLLSEENTKALFLYRQFCDKLPFIQNSGSSLQETQIYFTTKPNISLFDILKSSLVIAADNIPLLDSHNIPSNNKIKGIVSQIKIIIRKSKLASFHPRNFTDQTNNIIFQRFVRNDGKIDIKNIVQFIETMQMNIKMNNLTIPFNSLQTELQDPQSRMRICLSYIVSRKLVSKHPLLRLIIQFLKKQGKLEIKSSPKSKKLIKDWFSKFIVFKKEDISQISNFSFPSFPKISINIQALSTSLIYLIQVVVNDIPSNDRQNFIQELLSLTLKSPIQLLIQSIQAYALGILTDQPSMFQKSRGQSIHLNCFEIDSVIAFKKADELYCQFLRQLTGFDFMNYGSTKNQQLPSWMQFKLRPSAIILSGTPLQHDEEKFSIRIFDSTGFIVRQFEIEVRPQIILDQEKLSQQDQISISERNLNSMDSSIIEQAKILNFSSIPQKNIEQLTSPYRGIISHKFQEQLGNHNNSTIPIYTISSDNNLIKPASDENNRINANSIEEERSL